MALSVLIVDDHAEFRESARAVLEADGLTVIGEAADAGEALAGVVALEPDIVLLDVQLPDVDGFVVAELIASLPRPPVVVMISSRASTAYAARLSATSARGFIAKSQLSGTLVARLAR